MADPTVNERIAVLRGWVYVGLCEAERAWQAPDGEFHWLPPAYDSDWSATGELVESAKLTTVYWIDANTWGASMCLDLSGNESEGQGQTIPAATAAAYLKARESSGG